MNGIEHGVDLGAGGNAARQRVKENLAKIATGTRIVPATSTAARHIPIHFVSAPSVVVYVDREKAKAPPRATLAQVIAIDAAERRSAYRRHPCSPTWLR